MMRRGVDRAAPPPSLSIASSRPSLVARRAPWSRARPRRTRGRARRAVERAWTRVGGTWSRLGVERWGDLLFMWIAMATATTRAAAASGEVGRRLRVVVVGVRDDGVDVGVIVDVRVVRAVDGGGQRASSAREGGAKRLERASALGGHAVVRRLAGGVA